MLTRIYGTAFFSKEELETHLERLEQARARDHRRLGRELGLFFFSELSPGSPFWKPARDGDLERPDRALARGETARAATARSRRRILYDVELWQQSGPLGELQRPHVLHRRRGPTDGR